MNNKKVYLKAGDLMIADNVMLIYDGIKYILAHNGLEYSSKFILNADGNLEYPVKYEITEEDIKPYYQPSPTPTKVLNINENIFG
jgi:hypothetical protein